MAPKRYQGDKEGFRQQLRKQCDETYLYTVSFDIAKVILSAENDFQVEMLYGPQGHILSIVDKTSCSSARSILAYGNYRIALNNI